MANIHTCSLQYEAHPAPPLQKDFAMALTPGSVHHHEDDAGTEVAGSDPDGGESSVSSTCDEGPPSVFMRFLALVSANTSSMVRLSRLLSAETETRQVKRKKSQLSNLQTPTTWRFFPFVFC